MQVRKTYIKDLLIIEPSVFYDSRGFFYESYNKKQYFENNLNLSFVQDNVSKSLKGVIRGLHYQDFPYAQSKLVKCLSGKILDVVVDLRKNSKTYGNYFSIELSSENFKQLFVPQGFAHGFQVLTDEAIISYKVDNYYNLNSEFGIIWNDKDLSINWNQTIKPIISKKDLSLSSFKNIKSPF